ncbi:MAG: circadian phase modifier CpmA [Betaproteobacteria bacterium SG8_40]|jgi:NCAIR mutase (PurE)-related protein|nr:MAG: circadian phase modifier CpmA [Betaproteobacteria bacterium SG8_40]
MSLHKDIMLDFAREARTGLDEAVFCAGKTVAHIAEILRQVENRNARILLTRLEPDQFSSLPESQQEQIDYEPLSRTGYFSKPHPVTETRRVAVVAAGTSDVAVAREAARTLTYYGEVPAEISDVGVAGLWRLLERLEEIRSMKVVIAVAGMDAALPTVVGGLLGAPVIGVPTSVGYGASEGGQTALKAMLASCSPGLTVTNIDNGYGAACAALRILRLSSI